MPAANALSPTRSEPRVEVLLQARPNKTWYWVVRVFASNRKQLGEHWCERIAHRSVDGAALDVPREIEITGGAIAEHQQAHGSVFEPSEIAKLALEAYRELCSDLERQHGEAVPRRPLRG